ncbi:MAG: DNA-formamidopyrimidine glycosylase family protein [Anaerolineaceae bacterium]|nr:DNA-formamidopyrimidine glycosylase family protein [Anaerolineaceae bacterium]
MPELPEIANLARQMNAELAGKSMRAVEVFQSKCLNIPQTDFIQHLTGAKIGPVTHHGKWLFISTNQGWLLLNLGMGGEILLVSRSSLPEKYRLIFDFEDAASLAVNFWWFGYAHYVPTDQLATHTMTAKLGPNPLDLDATTLKALFNGQRSRLKAFMLDQSKIAGIGNSYIHDILFLAGLHPLRTVDSLKEAEIANLVKGIRAGLLPSLNKGGASYEVDLYGQKGGFGLDDVLIGYKENKPCPNCGAPIQKIKTGSTSSFICPNCQPLI